MKALLTLKDFCRAIEDVWPHSEYTVDQIVFSKLKDGIRDRSFTYTLLHVGSGEFWMADSYHELYERAVLNQKPQD